MFPTTDFKVSMNLSPKQLMNDSLFQDFQKILKKYRMNAKHIVLEVVEFTLYDKQDIIRKNIGLLKQLGFQIAIDGFGLDYKTLEKVAALNVDVIKLDSGFLSEEEDYMRAKFANLIVDFAKKHQCDIICELIETKDLMEAAKTYDIHLLQGYYFSQPISAEALRGYIGVSAWEQKIN
jgi:EAL domain-containing protein (putative c-di-GMP-specific phosphodiesterase class I)